MEVVQTEILLLSKLGCFCYKLLLSSSRSWILCFVLWFLNARFYGGCSKYVAVSALFIAWISFVCDCKEGSDWNKSLPAGNRCSQLCLSDRCPSLSSEDLCRDTHYENMCSVYPVLAGYEPTTYQLLKWLKVFFISYANSLEVL